MEVGSYLESQERYDLAYTIQQEVDILILPAIERLKDKGRAGTGRRLNILKPCASKSKMKTTVRNRRRDALVLRVSLLTL